MSTGQTTHRPAVRRLVVPSSLPSAAALAAPLDHRARWRAWRDDRPLRWAVASALVAACALQIAFVSWVHFAHEGAAYRAALPGAHWGIPQREAAAGMQSMCVWGYDGQFYYWMSNDLFARYDARQHIDNPAYRYQRIGVPAVAAGIATLLGYELTPPRLYAGVLIAFASAGFGGMVYWLKRHQMSGWWAVGWLLSTGMLHSLSRLLLDPAADALFFLTLLALIHKRLWIYVPLATMLVFVREMYAVFAFAAWIATLVNRCDWRETSNYWVRIAGTALPGALPLAWLVYVTTTLDVSPFDARGADGMRGFPGYWMCHFTARFLRDGDWIQFWPTASISAVVILVLGTLLWNARRLPVAVVCALPYLAFLLLLGEDIWLHYIGSTRIMGAAIVLGLVLAAYFPSRLLRVAIAAQALVGVWDMSHMLRDVHAMSPYLLHEDSPDSPNPKRWAYPAEQKDRAAKVEWVDATPVVRSRYQGLFRPVHRELAPVTVAVTNTGDVAWEQDGDSRQLWLGCRVGEKDAKQQLCMHSIQLKRDLAPGETALLTTYLELRQPDRDYWVEFSLWEPERGWFVNAEGRANCRHEFRSE